MLYLVNYMNSKYNVFIFDFDGTLADSRMNIANSFNSALVENNYSPIKNEKIYPYIGKETLEQHFIRFHPNISPNQFPKLIQDFRNHQIKFMREELKLFPNVVKTLKLLKGKNKSMAILTTKGTEQITKMMEILKIKTYFEVIYGRDLPYGEKPNKSCVEYILSNLDKNYSNNEVVMVGDTEIDAQTAENAGIGIVGVTYGIGTKKELVNKNVKQFIDSFDEILTFA